uniref:Uncharacterized protein n=1 Tax=viral metagenome TaxID=1070528 RepID=A0A6C0C8D6_9ZZZZ
MGRAFKLKYQSNNNNKKNKDKEEKITEVKYNHIYVIKTNPKSISEFKKNMENPSSLWDGDESFYKYTEKYDDLDIFKDQEND